MKTHTDSSIIEYNEDGSRTETTVITYQPATKAQKATAFGILGALFVAPFIPLVAAITYDKMEQRKARKAEAETLKSV